MIQIIITLKEQGETCNTSIAVFDTDGTATKEEVETATNMARAMAKSLELGESKDTS